MIYTDYHKSRIDYIKAYNKLCELEEQKEKLFQRTQPQGTKFDKSMVSGGRMGDSYAEYLIASEGMDEELEKARKEYHKCAVDMSKKLQALKNSLIAEDKIYYLKHCKQKTLKQIAEILNQTETQIYKTLIRMSQNIDREC